MKEKIQQILKEGVLPKDELDNFWDNFFGFLPLFLLMVIIKENIILFIAIFLLIGYVFFLKLNEKKIKRIDTLLNKYQNNILIENIAKSKKWTIKTIDLEGYYEFYIPIIFGIIGHKLTIISTEDKLFFNLRNIGTSKGRVPYMFGIDTIKEQKIINLFKNNSKT
ncbi:hypothetical protein IRZ83_04080 [Flavobacterium sp. JLP]|uniref:hypothetical protein n=1 Tax=unclassified Flavobacterium TaxID=196869 RepID=UPI00188C4430|nr:MULTISPECIES: hypothetical protein [unclassified Flavobacterium]MBF4491807.1 hypothetical protein [Flavobacterium sp. MR2016-29]MBF4505834.1 hypothetical protein [Flavobacterium sp. JLP]